MTDDECRRRMWSASGSASLTSSFQMVSKVWFTWLAGLEWRVLVAEVTVVVGDTEDGDDPGGVARGKQRFLRVIRFNSVHRAHNISPAWKTKG